MRENSLLPILANGILAKALAPLMLLSMSYIDRLRLSLITNMFIPLLAL